MATAEAIANARPLGTLRPPCFSPRDKRPARTVTRRSCQGNRPRAISGYRLASLDRRVGEAQLVAGAPFRADIIQHQRAADALDRTLLEAVIGIGAGNEDQPAIEVAGGGFVELHVIVVDVGAPGV